MSPFLGVSDAQIDAAQARVTAAGKTFSKAKDRWDAAEAQWAALVLLKLSEPYPGVEGFSYEEEWNYDDEGGYFHTATVHVSYTEPVAPGMEEAYEKHGSLDDADELFQFSVECCERLFGEPEQVKSLSHLATIAVGGE